MRLIAAWLAPLVPPRLSMLANAIVEYADGGDEEVARELWSHFRDALDR